MLCSAKLDRMANRGKTDSLYPGPREGIAAEPPRVLLRRDTEVAEDGIALGAFPLALEVRFECLPLSDGGAVVRRSRFVWGYACCVGQWHG